MVRREITYRGVKLEVEFEVVKSYRAPRESLGVPTSEDVLPGVDIESVYHKDEDITALLDGQFRAIERVIMEGGG